MSSFLDANTYYKQRFGGKLYKAAISLKVTCPNRDGSKGVGGCSFCSQEGSGEFASTSDMTVTEQIDRAIERLSNKIKSDTGIIAYFQSYTNTYCDSKYLLRSMNEAAEHPRIKAISIATRPDCLPSDILTVINEINQRLPVFVELGLQTSNDETARGFNRCYETLEYDSAVQRLHAIGVNVITHIILGLPSETYEDMVNTVTHVAECGSDGVKFTSLYILEGTAMQKLWEQGKLKVFEMEEYFDVVEKLIQLLPEGTVIHRLTGDGPKKSLLAPLWTSNKREVVNYINRRFKR